jgi:hypothetical protein
MQTCLARAMLLEEEPSLVRKSRITVFPCRAASPLGPRCAPFAPLDWIPEQLENRQVGLPPFPGSYANWLDVARSAPESK